MDIATSVDLADEIKVRSAAGAAAKLAGLPAAELVSQLADAIAALAGERLH